MMGEIELQVIDDKSFEGNTTSIFRCKVLKLHIHSG